MENKGILVRWNGQRGFGFIQSESFSDNVFVHISKLKHLSRKPKVGDVIFFDRVVNDEGKASAENVSIEGVAVGQKTGKGKSAKGKYKKSKHQKGNQHNQKSANYKWAIIAGVIVLLAVAGYLAKDFI